MSELDEQIESDLLDMWLLWERGNWYLNDDHPNYDKEHDRRFRDAIVEYITKLIADQVREARIDELYEKVEACFDLRISSSGASITIKLGGEQMTVDYEAFLELRKKIEALISDQVREARKL